MKKKKRLKASYTIEAALIISITFFTIGSLITEGNKNKNEVRKRYDEAYEKVKEGPEFGQPDYLRSTAGLLSGTESLK